MAEPRICAVEECDKPVRAYSYCRPHAMRFWRHGDPLGGGPAREEPMPADAPCTVDGCSKPRAKGRKYCSMHSERVRKHGDPHLGAAPTKGVCTISGCDSQHFALGYCRAHWKRFNKYGDPLAGSTKWGAVPEWLNTVALPYEGTDCLQFPYSRDTFGYGKIRISKRNLGAHVYVLTKVSGPKPTPAHECCHRCGKGHLGCVNPNHLYWGTRSDNVQDSISHGTFARLKR